MELGQSCLGRDSFSAREVISNILWERTHFQVNKMRLNRYYTTCSTMLSDLVFFNTAIIFEPKKQNSALTYFNLSFQNFGDSHLPMLDQAPLRTSLLRLGLLSRKDL